MTVNEQRAIDRLNAAIKPLQFEIMYNCKDPLEPFMFVDIGKSSKNGHVIEWIYWKYGSWDSINKMFFGATSIFVIMCNELKIAKISNPHLRIDRYQHLVNTLNAVHGDCIEEMLLKMDMIGI